MQGATRRGTQERKVAGCKWLGREANAAQQRWKKCTEMLVERLPLHIPGSSLRFVTAPPLLKLFLVRIWGEQTKETLCRNARSI